MSNRKMLIFLLLFQLFFNSCAYFSVEDKRVLNYNILVTTKQSYDATMQIVADLYQRQEITEEQKLQCVSAGKIFVAVYRSAVSVYSLSLVGEASTSPDLSSELNLVTDAMTSFMLVTKPILFKEAAQ